MFIIRNGPVVVQVPFSTIEVHALHWGKEEPLEIAGGTRGVWFLHPLAFPGPGTSISELFPLKVTH